MLEILSEHRLTLAQAASEYGRHVQTMSRWIVLGIVGPDGQRVFLESVRLGGVIFTSREAIERFIAKLSAREAVHVG